jgi:hypothetical protein
MKSVVVLLILVAAGADRALAVCVRVLCPEERKACCPEDPAAEHGCCERAPAAPGAGKQMDHDVGPWKMKRQSQPTLFIVAPEVAGIAQLLLAGRAESRVSRVLLLEPSLRI